MRQSKATTQQILRLDAIAQHLGVKRRYPDSDFTAEVVAASLSKVTPILRKLQPCTGEQLALGLADHLSVVFEEVHDQNDIDEIEGRYLKTKREIGFAQLRGELRQPGVDALLFQRMNATQNERDRWVAVLNLQESDSKGYWNRFHELSHRIAEPPQQMLPFKRHRFEASNPVEAVIDATAAAIAFYSPIVKPLVLEIAKRGRLDFGAVQYLHDRYAPTASLLATMNAVVKFWPRPAVALTAQILGRRSAPDVDRALRVKIQGFSDTAATAGLHFFPNMRVSSESPIFECFESGEATDGQENLGEWMTSDGSRLKSVNVYTASRRIGRMVYAVISL